ncbi:MAG: hypothetical protein J6M03_05790, partial [Clostridia bacterium]|nr:hypothetical protein [Clostridia bacterium]
PQCFRRKLAGLPCGRPRIDGSAKTTYNRLSAFSFDSKGAKEKANKKKTPKGEFRSLRRATKALPLETANFLKKV